MKDPADMTLREIAETEVNEDRAVVALALLHQIGQNFTLGEVLAMEHGATRMRANVLLLDLRMEEVRGALAGR